MAVHGANEPSGFAAEIAFLSWNTVCMPNGREGPKRAETFLVVAKASLVTCKRCLRRMR